jgi:hypothetical protein
MTATGEALEAIFDLLVALSEAPSPKVPEPLQNENLHARLQDLGETPTAMLLNIWDDSPSDEVLEVLGADDVEDGYEIEKEVTVEFIVTNPDRPARRAAFEDGLAAIHDAIKADRTLGGKVSDARMLAPNRNGAGLWADGMPNILAADIRVRLTYTSNRPF